MTAPRPSVSGGDLFRFFLFLFPFFVVVTGCDFKGVFFCFVICLWFGEYVIARFFRGEGDGVYRSGVSAAAEEAWGKLGTGIDTCVDGGRGLRLWRRMAACAFEAHTRLAKSRGCDILGFFVFLARSRSSSQQRVGRVLADRSVEQGRIVLFFIEGDARTKLWQSQRSPTV